jgi:hypothetical protein
MSEEFIFRGQTTFINKPRNIVIQDFQNTYITGNDSESDQINSEILKLVQLVLESKDLPNESKEETVQTLHAVADQVKEEKINKLTLKGTLTAIQKVVTNAADIAAPALAIVSTVFELLGLS